MTLTEQWKKGELPRGYYYAEDNGEELIIHIQEKNGSVMGDDFNLEATDWIKPIAPVPSYDDWKRIIDDWRDVSYENKKLKELLKECKDVLLSYSNINGDYKLYDKITNAIGEK